jgi:hypothetical protein
MTPTDGSEYNLGYGFEPWSTLKDKVKFLPRDLVLEMAVRLSIEVPGHLLEFGVYSGSSVTKIRDTLEANYRRGVLPRRQHKQVYGFDSFEGLREKFENVAAGHFKTRMPKVPRVKLVKGYFEDSLTPELAKEIGSVSFAHLDADLYSSTLCALNWMTPLLHTGSLLLFDEFLGENQSEKRALDEWVQKSGLAVAQVAEFSRDPSGHGPRVEKRALFQVIVGDGARSALPRFPLPRQLRGPLLPKLKRRANRLLGDR